MRLLSSVVLALVIAGCERPTAVDSRAPDVAVQQCTYEVVQPDQPGQASTAAAFRAWLKPHAGDWFGGDEVVDNGAVFVADLNNDGTDEVLFALHEGSGGFLNATIYRPTANGWSRVQPPFADHLINSHEYGGAFMDAPQLIARLCGKTIISFSGGSEPNYYPETLVWEGSTARSVCSEPWLTHHRAAAADLEKRGMLDEALVLLNGIQDGCEKESAAAVRSIKDDIGRITANTAAASTANYDFSWLIDAIREHPDQQLVLDRRFTAMLIAIIPDIRVKGETFRGALKKSVWLPDDPKVIDDRYLVIAGCEPHNCGNRGVVWIDTVAKEAIGMTGGAMASRTIDPLNIPSAFWTHTRSTLADWPVREWRFIRADGTTTPVKAP